MYTVVVVSLSVPGVFKIDTKFKLKNSKIIREADIVNYCVIRDIVAITMISSWRDIIWSTFLFGY